MLCLGATGQTLSHLGVGAPSTSLSLYPDISLRSTAPSCVQVAFFNTAIASAEEEQARLRVQLREQKARCRSLAQLAAPVQSKLEKETEVPRNVSDSVSEESNQALHVAMEKLQVSASLGAGRVGPARTPESLRPLFWLQSRFLEVMQEKVELKERVEELEHCCIQLSGETDTIGEAEPILVQSGLHMGPIGGASVSEPCPPACPPHRRVHCPLPKPEGSAEGPALGEGGVHQQASPGQGGDEGEPTLLWSRPRLGWAAILNLSACPSR